MDGPIKMVAIWKGETTQILDNHRVTYNDYAPNVCTLANVVLLQKNADLNILPFVMMRGTHTWLVNRRNSDISGF